MLAERIWIVKDCQNHNAGSWDMKFLSFTSGGRESWGAIKDDVVVDLGWHMPGCPQLIDALQQGRLEEAKARADAAKPDLPLAAVRYLPTIPNPEKIICIGLNYRKHAAETGQPVPKLPILFNKYNTALMGHRGVIKVSQEAAEHFDYEVELVAALHRGGRNIPVERALDLVYAYALGLDMTRRDLQRAMGDEKKPWEIGKSFDRSAPIGPLHLASATGHFRQGTIWLKVNGKIRQNANLNQMIWNVAEQISRLSQAFELFPGDIIYSGTPENVGPVVRGDVIDCHIDGLPDLSIRIT